MIGLLLITHGSIGSEFIKTARNTFGNLPLNIDSIGVDSQDDPNNKLLEAEKALRHVDQGHGVLVMTDIFGSTPSNIAHGLLSNNKQVQVVTGINLPMLFRVLNYAHLDLVHITQKALSGGKDGVLARESMDGTTA